MRTFGIFPVRRADKDFAVVPALVAMEFVDWHGMKICRRVEISRLNTEALAGFSRFTFTKPFLYYPNEISRENAHEIHVESGFMPFHRPRNLSIN